MQICVMFHVEHFVRALVYVQKYTYGWLKE
jgi:hypothetical protein